MEDLSCQLITAQNIKNTIKFISANEYFCVDLMKEILQMQSNFNQSIKNKHSGIVFVKKENATIIGVILFTNTRKIFHCFPITPKDTIFEIIKNKIDKNILTQTKTIIGEKNTTVIIEKYLFQNFSIKPSRFQNYKLFYLNIEKNKAQLQNTYPCTLNNKYSKCYLKDIENLLPLQIDYENVEVHAGYGKANPALTKLYLQHIVKTQHIYKAELNNSIIAKAGTNAIGLNCEQIGGVYTSPKYRGLGVAHALLKNMILSTERKKELSLYVKNENESAIRLYQKLGFIHRQNFRIAYFEK